MIQRSYLIEINRNGNYEVRGIREKNLFETDMHMFFLDEDIIFLKLVKKFEILL